MHSLLLTILKHEFFLSLPPHNYCAAGGKTRCRTKFNRCVRLCPPRNVVRPSERTERSAAVDTAGADRAAAVVRPNPEVVAKATRRRFTAEYKRQILVEATQRVRNRRDWRSAAARGPVFVAPHQVAAGPESSIQRGWSPEGVVRIEAKPVGR